MVYKTFRTLHVQKVFMKRIKMKKKYATVEPTPFDIS